MKYLMLLVFLAGSSVFAADYGSVRCEFFDDSKMEKVFGKFKKMQTECCKKRLETHEACDSREEYQKCARNGQGTLNAVESGVECSEGCKQFRKDCDDYIETREVNKYL